MITIRLFFFWKSINTISFGKAHGYSYRNGSFYCLVSLVKRFLVLDGAGPGLPLFRRISHTKVFSQETKAFLYKGFRNGQKVTEKRWFEA